MQDKKSPIFANQESSPKNTATPQLIFSNSTASATPQTFTMSHHQPTDIFFVRRG